jgi:hypothetical protein
MKLSEKLSRFIEGKQAQIKRGIKVTEKMKAEKQREKLKKAANCGPGSFRYGLAYKQSISDFMKDVYEKRKADRENKEKQ